MRNDLVDISTTIDLTPCSHAFGRPNAPSSARMVATSGMLILYGDHADWVIEATKRLDAIGRLQRGWDSYSGRPLREGSKAQTLFALECLQTKELPVPRVVLGPEGNVHLEWRTQERELELELAPDSIGFVKVMPDGEVLEDRDPISAIDPTVKLATLSKWLLTGAD